MTRSNILWGLGGAIVGAIATYFVMEYIYEKEIELFNLDFNIDAVIHDLRKSNYHSVGGQK